MRVIGFLAILCVLLLGSACSNKDTADIPPLTSGDSTLKDVAFPFVESVEFPATIKAGEPFTVRLHISAPLFPEAFYSPVGLNRMGLTSHTNFVDGSVEGYVIDPHLAGVGTTAPPVDSISLNLNLLPAGDYKLWVYSADTPEHGGFTTKHKSLPSEYIAPHPWLVQREFPFTVVP